MNELLTLINLAFSGAGFNTLTEESAAQLHFFGNVRFAVPKIKKAECSPTVSGRGEYIGQEETVTAAIRCYGTECGYSDGDGLRTMVGTAKRIMLLNSASNVRWLSTGELVRDPVTRRLVITVIAELTGYTDAEVGEA